MLKDKVTARYFSSKVSDCLFFVARGMKSIYFKVLFYFYRLFNARQALHSIVDNCFGINWLLMIQNDNLIEILTYFFTESAKFSTKFLVVSIESDFMSFTWSRVLTWAINNSRQFSISFSTWVLTITDYRLAQPWNHQKVAHEYQKVAKFIMIIGFWLCSIRYHQVEYKIVNDIMLLITQDQ